MNSLEEILTELRNAAIDQHRQTIKAVLICNADKHIIQVSRITTRITLTYIKMIENRFVFKRNKKEKPLNTSMKIISPELNSEETRILIDILTRKGE